MPGLMPWPLDILSGLHLPNAGIECLAVSIWHGLSSSGCFHGLFVAGFVFFEDLDLAQFDLEGLDHVANFLDQVFFLNFSASMSIRTLIS